MTEHHSSPHDGGQGGRVRAGGRAGRRTRGQMQGKKEMKTGCKQG